MGADKIWTIKEMLGLDDPKKLKKIKLEDGTICDVLDSKLARSLYSWDSIKSDLEFSKQCFELKIHQQDEIKIYRNKAPINTLDILTTALIKAAVVSYAKPFVGSLFRNITLNKDIYKGGKFEDTHEKLMDERKNFHAHSGQSTSQISFTLLSSKQDKNGGPVISTIHLSIIKYDTGLINDFISTINFAIKHTEGKIQEVTNKLIDELK